MLAELLLLLFLHPINRSFDVRCKRAIAGTGRVLADFRTKPTSLKPSRKSLMLVLPLGPNKSNIRSTVLS